MAANPPAVKWVLGTSVVQYCSTQGWLLPTSGEHNGVFGGHLADVGDQAAGVNWIGITLTIGCNGSPPFLSIPSDLLMPHGVVSGHLFLLRHVDQLGQDCADISHNAHIHRVVRAISEASIST